MKGRAGLNDIWQSHRNRSTPASMICFLTMASNERILDSEANSIILSGYVPDINLLGIHKLQEDFVKKNLERFHWPLASNYSPGNQDEGEYQNSDEREGFGEPDEELVTWIGAESN